MPSPDPIGDARNSEDWEVGDLALCICTDPWADLPEGVAGPQNGQIMEVKDLDPDGLGWCCMRNAPYLGLVFEAWPRESWCSCSFTKIKPLSEDEKREFEADLRHDQRVPAPVSLEVDSSSWSRLPMAEWLRRSFSRS